MSKIENGHTLREMTGAIVKAHQELVSDDASGKSLSPYHTVYSRLDIARERARQEAGDNWTIRVSTGPRKKHELAYDQPHTAEIFGKFKEMVEEAVGDLPGRYVLPLRQVEITPPVVRRAEKILFEPENTEDKNNQVEGKVRSKSLLVRFLKPNRRQKASTNSS